MKTKNRRKWMTMIGRKSREGYEIAAINKGDDAEIVEMVKEADSILIGLFHDERAYEMSELEAH